MALDLPEFDIDNQSGDDARVVDICDGGGIDTVVAVTAGSPVRVKVGGSNKEKRLLVLVQADGKIKFGFSNSTQSFRAFKDQIISADFGPGTDMWVDAVAGTVNVSFGEVS